jgi:transcriptional regulator of acetoin/glycerol metabolism
MAQIRSESPDSPLHLTGNLAHAAIAASWQRSRAAGVDASHAPLHRIDDHDLQRRLRENNSLIRVAALHVEWLSRSLAVRHVVYLVDRDGIVLYAAGTAPELMDQLGLAPGFDWSERRMGTNAAGTALAAGHPVAVVGDEHFVEAFRNSICTAAPVLDPGGNVIGALDITTGLEEGAAERLLLAAHVAFVIQQ